MLFSRTALLTGSALAGLVSLGSAASAGVILTGNSFHDSANTNALFIGDGGSGAATVSPPGPNAFSAIVVGGSVGPGAITVSGSGAQLIAMNSIGVGQNTTGSLLIQNGGSVVSQGGASPFCSPCNSTTIGNAAGANGTVTVTGTGSSFTVGSALGSSGFFIIGNGNVAPGFGVPGAPTTGTFNVLDGATATTTATIIANSNLLTGQSASTGTVTVSGPGSTWNVIDHSPGLSSFINIGQEGNGTVNIESGGTVNAKHITVGRSNGSVGVLKIDGNGSTLNLIGSSSAGAASLNVGRFDGASGSVQVVNGGKINIDATGSPTSGGGMTIGGSEGAGNGIMIISGVGSLVTIKGDNNALASGGLAPGFTVGAGGSGQLSILAGGQLITEDTSTAATGGMGIGGRASENLVGHGSVLISGTGSLLEIRSQRGGFGIGGTAGSSGDLTVQDGGRLVTHGGNNIGSAAGSVGTMNVKDSGTLVEVTGINSFGNGATMTVGRAGVGTLNVSDGATLSITGASGAPFAGLLAGGNNDQPSAGTGTINVTNGGRIDVSGDISARISLGGNTGGTGTLNIVGGGQVTVSNSPGESGVFIGRNSGSNGVALVSGSGSLLDGGSFIGVGIGVDKISDTGTGILTVRDGGVARAGEIRIGSNGVLNGNGTIVGDVVNAGGIIAPGNSPGMLTIDGSLTMHSGILQIEVEGLEPGQFDVLNVLGDIDLAGSTIEFLFEGFLPQAGDSFDFLISTDVDPFNGVNFTYKGAGPGLRFEVSNDGVFRVVEASTQVPEPGTLVLLILALLLGAAATKSRMGLAAPLATVVLLTMASGTVAAQETAEQRLIGDRRSLPFAGASADCSKPG
jgi:T5SS/PEP-CTERM-associated repeat protein